MKLSEAMELGSLIRPQAFGDLRICKDETWGSCALGAAFEAAKCPVENRIARGKSIPFRGAPVMPGEKILVTICPPSWNRLFDKIVNCPTCGEANQLKQTITHLNDFHKWDRIQIAEWVRQYEPKPRKKPTSVISEVATESMK